LLPDRHLSGDLGVADDRGERARETAPLEISLQLRFSELQAIVSPEAAVSDEKRRHTENPARQSDVGVLAQGVLDLLILRRSDQRLAVEPCPGQSALDHGRVRDVLSL